jgi:hypothetical protein
MSLRAIVDEQEVLQLDTHVKTEEKLPYSTILTFMFFVDR